MVSLYFGGFPPGTLVCPTIKNVHIRLIFQSVPLTKALGYVGCASLLLDAGNLFHHMVYCMRLIKILLLILLLLEYVVNKVYTIGFLCLTPSLSLTEGERKLSLIIIKGKLRVERQGVQQQLRSSNTVCVGTCESHGSSATQPTLTLQADDKAST